MPRDYALLEGLSTEARLLLLAAGPRSTDQEVASLLTTHRVDWPALLSLADRERATGVLWRRLRDHPLPTLTEEWRAPFERVAMIGDFTAGYLEQRIGETMAALNATRVDALLLKGAALAVSVYGSFAERPMGDVDLAVPGGRRSRHLPPFRAWGGAGMRRRFRARNIAGTTTIPRSWTAAGWTCASNCTPNCSSRGARSH